MLRAATADLHAAVDARFSGSFESVATYAAFLAALASALVPLERALEASGIGRALPDWPRRRRADVLLADLAILGATLPALAQPPDVRGEARQFGVAYVLEGSRLGGKLLLRRALGHADPSVRAATGYLSQGTGDLWPSFIAQLDTSPAVRRAPAEAIAGARLAFSLFCEPAHG
jgi:heme oxygenase